MRDPALTLVPPPGVAENKKSCIGVKEMEVDRHMESEGRKDLSPICIEDNTHRFFSPCSIIFGCAYVVCVLYVCIHTSHRVRLLVPPPHVSILSLFILENPHMY